MTEKIIQLGACLEQVTPGIRYDQTFPGESFKRDIASLKAMNNECPNESLDHLLKVVDRLTALPNDQLIQIVGIFEYHLMMHERINL